MKLEIFQIDAFTSEPFHGNPAAVVPLTEWLPDETMLDIAAENNLAETAFFVKNGEGFDLRWFTPTVEMDLCGHATLASAYVLWNQLGHTGETLNFETRSGTLTVTRENGRMVMDFPSRPATETEIPFGLADALGAKPTEVLKSRDFLAVYETEADVLALKPDFRAIIDLGVHAVIVTAPGEKSDFVSRFFAPLVGVDEDPVTGSSHCTLIPYWAERLGKNKLFARQVSPRGGELFCSLDDKRVKIGGDAVLYLKGEIYVEAEKSFAA
ncbi:MAG: PhzF family phenazine biosynthesis protein [Pyrinomonadaceae bacterium]|nr:PhzF family phenazine biosynthesis protein [Pyrinomonadaceae bacterium]